MVKKGILLLILSLFLIGCSHLQNRHHHIKVSHDCSDNPDYSQSKLNIGTEEGEFTTWETNCYREEIIWL